ncbi:hypothetical protein FHW94_004635 [Novosphingobium sp. SG720]|nr:hypothetical protein [Novosphingobium sp. SG720]
MDFAAVVPGSPDQFRLPNILPSPLAQRVLLPGMESAGLHGKEAADCSHAKTIAMLGNEGKSNFASRAK